jgi:hypothetical protein
MNCHYCGKDDQAGKVLIQPVIVRPIHMTAEAEDPAKNRQQIHVCEFCNYAALRMLGHAQDYFRYYGRR